MSCYIFTSQLMSSWLKYVVLICTIDVVLIVLLHNWFVQGIQCGNYSTSKELCTVDILLCLYMMLASHFTHQLPSGLLHWYSSNHTLGNMIIHVPVKQTWRLMVNISYEYTVDIIATKPNTVKLWAYFMRYVVCVRVSYLPHWDLGEMVVTLKK